MCMAWSVEHGWILIPICLFHSSCFLQGTTWKVNEVSYVWQCLKGWMPKGKEGVYKQKERKKKESKGAPSNPRCVWGCTSPSSFGFWGLKWGWKKWLTASRGRSWRRWDRPLRFEEVLSREPRFDRWQKLAGDRWKGTKGRSQSGSYLEIYPRGPGFLFGVDPTFPYPTGTVLPISGEPRLILSLLLQKMVAVPRIQCL